MFQYQKKAFSSRKIFSEKLLAFLYLSMIKFSRTDKVKGIPLSRNFIENLKGIMTNTIQLHHSHITGKIIGYAHKVTVIAHNLFRFYFFFLLKGLRAGVWRTRDLNIGGKNPTDINFADSGNQILFLDTIKYFQQSLGVLAKSLTDEEKSAISRECEKLIKNDPRLAKKHLSCTEEEQKWVLDYLSTGKATILYEVITTYDSLDIEPENGQFFLPRQFYSSLKNNIMTDEEYENVKKFYKTMKLENLGELNKIYNFQDTVILCAIF